MSILKKIKNLYRKRSDLRPGCYVYVIDEKVFICTLSTLEFSGLKVMTEPFFVASIHDEQDVSTQVLEAIKNSRYLKEEERVDKSDYRQQSLLKFTKMKSFKQLAKESIAEFSIYPNGSLYQITSMRKQGINAFPLNKFEVEPQNMGRRIRECLN